MKVLFASRYVDPYSIGSNKNIYLQAKSLRDSFKIKCEILTWPYLDGWTGPVPEKSIRCKPLRVERAGLCYHVFRAPEHYEAQAGGAWLSKKHWEEAVHFGMEMLLSLDPSIVHLHHRHGFWWILESAQRLGIPTVYTSHDWGIPCMRTVLVRGDKSLCDGLEIPGKCVSCIGEGRTSRLGRMNEQFVNNTLGKILATLAVEFSVIREPLLRRGFVTEPIAYRVARHHQQATQVFERLSHCFTPSEFGAKLFAQLGCPPEKISILPWYHDPINTRKNLSDDQPFTLTYVGRVSPEKGVDVIFSALEKDLIDEPVLLRVVGADDTPYCIYLRDKYPMSVGIHRVEWHSWTQPEALFNSTDVSIVPSIWMDNTPLSLIESLSYRVPVIATRIPTIEELLVEGETGFFADYRSTESLAYAISRAARRKHVIRQNATSFPLMYGLNEYMEKVVHQYRRIHAQCFAQ